MVEASHSGGGAVEVHMRIPGYEIDESRLERVHMSNVHGVASVPRRF